MNAPVRRASGRTPSTPRPALRVRRAATGRGKRDVQKRIEEELSQLRSLFRETVKNYAARVEGEIAQIREAVKGEGQDGEEVIQAMLTSIRQLKVKLEKGRRKDLKRIHDLVQEVRQWTGAG